MRTISEKKAKENLVAEMLKGTEKLFKRYHGITGFELRRAANYEPKRTLHYYGKASRRTIEILEGNMEVKLLPTTLSNTIDEYLKLKDFDEKYAPSRLYNPKEINEIRKLLGFSIFDLSCEAAGSVDIIACSLRRFNKTGEASRLYLVHMSYHLNRLMDEKGISYE